ncbi:hypothetical protein K3001_20660, partial [Pseudomonas aeruginosa]|nr:hypothetical protein [Pseudomonas aeruginosa]
NRGAVDMRLDAGQHMGAEDDPGALASPHNPQWLERWHRAGLAARRLDGQRIEVLLDDAERDGVLEALLAAREFDLEILPPSLEDLYRHHMSPAPAGATPCP